MHQELPKLTTDSPDLCISLVSSDKTVNEFTEATQGDIPICPLGESHGLTW